MRLAALAALATSTLAFAPAQAAEQVVTGTVAPAVGLGLGPATSTPAMIVTTEQRGDVLYVTGTPVI